MLSQRRTIDEYERSGSWIYEREWVEEESDQSRDEGTEYTDQTVESDSETDLRIDSEDIFDAGMYPSTISSPRDSASTLHSTSSNSIEQQVTVSQREVEMTSSRLRHNGYAPYPYEWEDDFEDRSPSSSVISRSSSSEYYGGRTRHSSFLPPQELSYHSTTNPHSHFDDVNVSYSSSTESYGPTASHPIPRSASAYLSSRDSTRSPAPPYSRPPSSNSRTRPSSEAYLDSADIPSAPHSPLDLSSSSRFSADFSWSDPDTAPPPGKAGLIRRVLKKTLRPLSLLRTATSSSGVTSQNIKRSSSSTSYSTAPQTTKSSRSSPYSPGAAGTSTLRDRPSSVSMTRSITTSVSNPVHGEKLLPQLPRSQSGPARLVVHSVGYSQHSDLRRSSQSIIGIGRGPPPSRSSVSSRLISQRSTLPSVKAYSNQATSNPFDHAFAQFLSPIMGSEMEYGSESDAHSGADSDSDSDGGAGEPDPRDRRESDASDEMEECVYRQYQFTGIPGAHARQD